jgi:hypothetical protein
MKLFCKQPACAAAPKYALTENTLWATSMLELVEFRRGLRRLSRTPQSFFGFGKSSAFHGALFRQLTRSLREGF